MELIINHKIRYFERLPASLKDLIFLETEGKTRGIAVSVNHQVVPLPFWKKTLLKNQDSILIIVATQGG